MYRLKQEISVMSCCINIPCLWGVIGCLGCKTSISRKFIFFPPKSSYKINISDSTNLTIGNNIIQSNSFFDIKKTKVDKKAQIASLFIKNPSSKWCFIFFHGNATDLGGCYSILANLSTILKVSVFSYDYRGYGESSGKSNIKNIYKDSELVVNDFIETHGVDPEEIVLCGHSLGTVLALYLASRKFGPQQKNVKGIILESPFTTGLKIFDSDLVLDWRKDVFCNEEEIKKVECPVMIIHGALDEIVPVNHAKILAGKTPNLFKLWILKGAGHNDIISNQGSNYYTEIGRFLDSLSKDEI